MLVSQISLSFPTSLQGLHLSHFVHFRPVVGHGFTMGSSEGRAEWVS